MHTVALPGPFTSPLYHPLEVNWGEQRHRLTRKQIVIAYITPHLLTTIGWGTYLLYAIFCILTTLFVLFWVPETRNVPLGREMDALFDDEKDIDEEEEMEEETETTLLLKHGQRERRGSLGVYT